MYSRFSLFARNFSAFLKKKRTRAYFTHGCVSESMDRSPYYFSNSKAPLMIRSPTVGSASVREGLVS